ISGGNATSDIYPNNNGGGMFNDHSSPAIINCIFIGNRAVYGGGMYNSQSSPVLTNVTLSGNHAYLGGGMFNSFSSPVLTNVTLSGNDANSGGGMYNLHFSSPKIYNSLIWGNTATVGTNIYNTNSTSEYYHSLIGGSGGSGDDWNGDFGTDGGGNIDADPLFTDPASGDYSLQASSPAIDAWSRSE